MNYLTASCYWLITGAELAVVSEADAKQFFQMEARVKQARCHLEREGPCCADARYKNDRNTKLEKYIYGERDSSLNILLLTPAFPKSALCTAACSLVIMPRERIYFHLSGFSWGFLLSPCLFCSVGFSQILYPSECHISQSCCKWWDVWVLALYSSTHSTVFCPGTEITDRRLHAVDRGNCTMELKNVCLRKYFSVWYWTCSFTRILWSQKQRMDKRRKWESKDGLVLLVNMGIPKNQISFFVCQSYLPGYFYTGTYNWS